MKKGLVKLIAGALAGMFLLSGCDALPKGSDGPREVPQTITADFTKKENKGNWVTYGDCKVTLKDGTAVVTERNQATAVSQYLALITEATRSRQLHRQRPKMTHSLFR